MFKTGFLLGALLVACTAAAQDGRLDSTFYTGPIGLRPLAGAYTLAEGTYGFEGLLLEDGTFVRGTVQNAPDGTQRLRLVRYTSAGAVDPAFGGMAPRRATSYEPVGLSRLPDGTFILMGYALPIRLPGDADAHLSTFYYAAQFLARFDTNGRPDTTFGVRGVLLATLYEKGTSYPYAVRPQRDGRLVVAGGWYENGCHDCATLIRLLPNGARDSTFGSNGFVRFDPNTSTIGGDDVFFDLAVLPDDRIVGAGLVGGRFGLARFTADGHLDPTFGTGGYTTLDYGTTNFYGRAYTLTVLPDGRFLAAGYLFAPYGPGANVSGPVVVRFRSDGTLDPTFGMAGVAHPVAPGPGFHFAWGLFLQADGRLLISGDGYNPATATGDYFVSRLTAEGQVDPTFGLEGHTFLDNGYGEERGYSLRVLPDGDLLGVGQTLSSTLFLVRLSANGTPEAAFPRDRQPYRHVPGLAQIGGLMATPQGDLYVSGRGNALLVKLRTDGAPDPTYGRNGTVLFASNGFDRSSAVLLPNGGVVVADGDGYNNRWRALRVSPEGTVDSAFMQGGFPRGQGGVRAIALAPGSGFVLAGVYGNRFVVAKLRTDGTADDTFGAGGMARLTSADTTGAGEAVTVLPDGRIVAAGSRAKAFTVVRLLPPGTPDPTFGTGGMFTAGTGTAYTLLSQPAGAFIVAGTLTVAGISRFAVLRLRADGTPDPAFGTNGWFFLPASQPGDVARVLLALPDGSFIAGGRWNATDFANGQTLVRLRADGTLNPTFGTQGIVHTPFGTARALVLLPSGRLLVGSDSDSPSGGTLTAYTLAAGTLLGAAKPEAARAAPMMSAPAPNPASGIVSLNLVASPAVLTVVDLYDALGRHVARLHEGAGEARLQVETAALSPGLYVLRARNAYGATTRPLAVVRGNR